MRLPVLRLCVPTLLAWSLATGLATAATLFVSPTGNDGAAGTAAAPLATLKAALQKIGPPGGGEIVLLDGIWSDRSRVSGTFQQPVLIHAANPGQAVLQDCFINGAANLVIEGVRFDGKDKKKVANVCQVSGGSYLTLRNCDFTHGVGGHDNADPLKVNQGSNHVLVENCRLFDGTDEELDILENGVRDLVFRDNVFYNDKVKKHEASASVKWNVERVVFAGNVFANMNPEASNGGLRFGGSETMEKRPHDLLALDNVFIGNDGRCDFCLCGATRVLVAGNVFFGQKGRGVIEATSNFPDANLVNDELFIVNNIIAHPTGGLPTIYAKRNGSVDKFTISNNLYFNGGKRVVAKQKGEAFFDPAGELGAQVADPLFVGPLAFEGTPQLDWKAALAVRDTSPYLKVRVPLEQLELPASLRSFARAYMLGEGDDEWYRRIRGPAAAAK